MSARILRRIATPARWFVVRHKRLASLVEWLFDHVPLVQDMLLELAATDPGKSYARWIAAYDTIDESDVAAVRAAQSRLKDPPLLSLLVPLEGARASHLEALTREVVAQPYPHWELSFVGECPDDATILAWLESSPVDDARIQSFHAAPSAQQGWNEALRSARGDFAVAVDTDVSIRPHALYLFASAVIGRPDALLMYADDDVIDDTGARSDHDFKPGWNEALLRSQNYLGGLVGFRRKHAVAVGGVRDDLDGQLLWSLFLRLSEGAPPGAIHHLPFVLSHRRHAARSEHETDQRPTRETRITAHVERLATLGSSAAVEAVGEASFRTRYVLPASRPTVSVIVPTTGEPRLFRPCLEGLLQRTSYAPLEILLAVDELEKRRADQRALLESAAAKPHVRLLTYGDRPFNYSWVNNFAVDQAQGALVCFLNDDTNVISREWLEVMVGHVLQKRVAAVGAKLYFRNGRIQHAGVLLGVGGLAAHASRGRPKDWPGYHDRGLVDQDVSCVTAACMLVRRDVFLEVGGFDDALATAFNDVDLCLRLRANGWRILWTPSAELHHYESTSFGRHDAGERAPEWAEAWRLIHRRWNAELMFDEHYNPNLSHDAMRTWAPAFPPRVSYPWRTSARGDVPVIVSTREEH